MKKSWLEQNPYWKIPFGCLTLIFLIALFVVVLMTVITTSFRNSDVYKQALAQAASNSQVRLQIGEPLKPAWLISGQLNVSGSTGNANLSIPISGPRGKGTIRAIANKTGRVWRFTYLQISVDGHPASIDLLSIQPPAERDF
jgi:heme/copper-type cytochrome/quinol oxidase subunit 2